MKRLPAGESSFVAIREGGWLYVDKTEVIHRLVSEGKFFFLSRPRRFGKSLLMSTLKAMFEGRKDLFEGLWIFDKYDWTEQYPVISISFTSPDYKTQPLETALSNAMNAEAKAFGIRLEAGSSKEKFSELILALGERGKVVVLIDEYDKPILDYLHDHHQGEENRDNLKSFFGILKSPKVVDVLRFVFLTGVSKFSKVSVFSELNNLTDLTLHRRYTTLLGITQAELERDFAEHIEAVSAEMEMSREDFLEKTKRWYNGYTWDGKNFVYNPFSLLHLFNGGEFQDYWFRSGTTSWLVKNMRMNQVALASLEGRLVEPSFFEKFELKNLDPVTLLYQTGYLTIKKVLPTEPRRYVLDYPNFEVRQSLFANLFQEYSEKPVSEIGSTIWRLEETLRQNDLPAFIGIFKVIFADIGSRLLKQYIEQDKIQLWEAYYQTVIYLALNLTGNEVACEVQTNHGYIDAVASTDKYVYIMEFKVGKAADAIAQIREKRYFEKYAGQGRQVFLAGVGFDADQRNIGDWVVEEISL
jgi:hypothetical protein